MMLPFVPYDLQNFLDATNTFTLKPQQIKYVMFQLLSSVYYVHSAEIVHRNNKLTSILSGMFVYFPCLLFIYSFVCLFISLFCLFICLCAFFFLFFSFFKDESCNIKLGSFGHSRSLKNLPLSGVSISRFSAPELCYVESQSIINWKRFVYVYLC
jgi:serine/threonine protein kinase